jgi:hypothetical protein
MRSSTNLLGISLLTALTACSSYGGGSAAAGGSPSGGGSAGTATSAGGSEVSQAGSPSTPGGGVSSSAGGAVGASGASGASSPGGGSPSSGGSSALGGAGGSSAPSAKAQVITWVPPYHISESKQRLSAMYGNLGAGDGLSELALQFWVTNGPAVNLGASEADVTWFHDWARQHGVKILLCVDNFVGTDWNWGEAERSFKDNGPAFAASIVSEIAKRDFDGVDLDLEGIVADAVAAQDQAPYLQLTKTLAAALHPLGKVVTMDSFYAQYNAPNWNWWPDLLPVVDGITSMGYEKTGLATDPVSDYQKLTDHAMVSPQKLTLGVPSYQDNWLGNTVNEQLAWIIKQGQIGVGIWDASFSKPGWLTQDTWAQLKTIKTR